MIWKFEFITADELIHIFLFVFVYCKKKKATFEMVILVILILVFLFKSISSTVTEETIDSLLNREKYVKVRVCNRNKIYNNF